MYSYIHIPFCESKCSYCRFASYAGLDRVKINFYVDFLCREIESSSISKQLLQSVYFGGGTPTTLTVQQLERILKTLKQKYGFSKNIEITLETTPENVNTQTLNDWKDIGINRISMGIQSLNDKTLKEIKRQPSKEIYRALKVLESGIIENISVDFIIGLPFVKKGELENYVSYILKNYKIIKHISVYMLEDYYEIADEVDSKFQNVVYPVNWSKDGLAEDEFLKEYVDVRKNLKKSGYKNYEISNFSKKGYKCQHNRAYWNHSEIAAFGLGTSGFIDQVRYKNSDDFGEYYRGENIEIEELTEKDIILEKVMFGLRTDGFDILLLRYINHKKYEHLKAFNFLKEKKERVVLGKKAYTLLDTVILELFKEY